jgi:hypothetical protein
LISSFRANVICDLLAFLARVHFESLQELLEISAIPVQKSKRHQSFLLNLFFLGKVDWLNTLEIAAILCIYLALNQLFQSLRLREKPKILHLVQLLLLSLFTDADVSTLENFRTETCFREVLCVFGSASRTSGIVLGNHLTN